MSSQRQRIMVANPRADHAYLREDIIAAMVRVFDSGSYMFGPEVARFEKSMADRIGTTGAVGVGSGTDALVLALLALGVGPGDEVLTVSHTAGPTVAAVLMVGAVPVLVDIDPSIYCLDPKTLQEAANIRTKAIIPVHLYGHPCDMEAICAFAQTRHIPVIEDCAQALEATINGRAVGSIGDVGCFSFYPTKNLGAIGDGGLVAARTRDIVDRLYQLRTYGWSKPQFSEVPNGRCSRLDELQAAILNVKLEHLACDIERRREIAGQYNAEFADLPLVLPAERLGCRHTYHLYVVRCDRRDALAEHLARAGIGSGIHYPFPVHVQPGLAAGSRIPQPLRFTEAIADEILTLPLHPGMPLEARRRVIESVRSYFGKS